ncbi:MAG: M20 family metallopeptidase [Bacillota bacterium]|nr:M20 family metallopeptidase [Bacillota bacterium]
MGSACVPETAGRLKRLIGQEIDSIATRLIEVSDDIHAHPEIRFEEYYASKLLADELEEHGFMVERGNGGLPTAFKAERRFGSEGPTIAILGEYDALPGLGHGCGHNIMGTAALGAGVGLARVLAREAEKAGISGRLIVFGTPAEEGGGGKVYMVRAGCFEGVDAAMIIHPGNANRINSRSIASQRLIIRFHGRPAHAAATPHEGVNALDAMILTYNGINALRQHVKPDVRIHGVIMKGGDAPNTIPDLTEAMFTIRAATSEYRNVIMEKVKNCARGAALQTGATVDLELYGLPFDPMKSNSVLEDAFRTNVNLLGLEEDRAPREGLGSTDMGTVSQAVPSIHPSIAIGPKGLIGHTQAFCDASRSPDGHKGLVAGAKCMAMTALDLFMCPEVLEKAWAEFRAG